MDSPATAFPHSQDPFSMLVLAQWLDPAESEANIAWARETFESLRPHLTERRYTNFLSADDAVFSEPAV